MIRATVCSEVAKRIVGELVGNGIQVLRRIGDPCRARRQHGSRKLLLRELRAIHDDFVFLCEQICLIGGENRRKRVGTRRLTEQRLSHTCDGNWTCGRNVKLIRRLT